MDEKSSKQNTQLNQVQDAPSIDSVFDFLYYDIARIAALLSQLDANGHLTSITQSQSAKSNFQSDTSIEGKGSVKILGGSAGQVWRSGEGQDLSNSRTFDPRWANALNFLDLMHERGFINKDLPSARLGQIAQFSGDLSIFDTGIMRQMWSLQSFRQVALAHEDASKTTPPPVRNKHVKGPKPKPMPSDMEVAFEMMSVLHHAVQCSVTSQQHSVWSTLDSANLTIPAIDLFMKHGIKIEGQWHVIGILDALPSVPDYLDRIINNPGEKLSGLASQMSLAMEVPIRALMGRPDNCYGVTPLLIFREIGR